MGSDDRQRETIDDLDVLLASLPPEIVEAVNRLPDREALIEVVMDLGRQPEGRFPDAEVSLLDREVTEADIAFVIDHIGSFGDDNRAGIERTLHRISAIRNRNGKVVGLTLRVGRAVYGTIEIIADFVETGKSILIMGMMASIDTRELTCSAYASGSGCRSDFRSHALRPTAATATFTANATVSQVRMKPPSPRPRRDILRA